MPLTLRSTLIAVGGAATLVVAGCGGNSAPPPRTPGPAPHLSARVPGGESVPHVQPSELRAPIRRYRRHVSRELAAMSLDVATLQSAVMAGALLPARLAWRRADARYESIGAAYGAFGDYDAAINGRPGGLEGGVHSPHFTGLHRIELALWGRDSVRDARPYTARLASDLRRLRRALPGMAIEPLEITLRVHEVLEDTLQLQLAGVASPWAGAAVDALRANADGTQVLLEALKPLVLRRDPAVLASAEGALTRLRSAVGEVPFGAPWPSLALHERERLSGLTAAATERLAFLPELLDPRTPRPPSSPFAGGRVTR